MHLALDPFLPWPKIPSQNPSPNPCHNLILASHYVHQLEYTNSHYDPKHNGLPSHQLDITLFPHKMPTRSPQKSIHFLHNPFPLGPNIPLQITKGDSIHFPPDVPSLKTLQHTPTSDFPPPKGQ
ncbi:unnamed protein product [Cuscuta campestris]|uniref:Uncharacterized protein n=1 Tax=Cuscuta campestris TaxID=132261 RepID=A0A484KTG2_9ASTE|nr:unnamed protein product [Cuscuta campestris]